jgi:hypothetical protein
MQSIGRAQTERIMPAPRVLLAMIVITAALLIAVAASSAVATAGRSDLPRPAAGHSVCIANAASGPCS